MQTDDRDLAVETDEAKRIPQDNQRGGLQLRTHAQAADLSPAQIADLTPGQLAGLAPFRINALA